MSATYEEYEIQSVKIALPLTVEQFNLLDAVHTSGGFDVLEDYGIIMDSQEYGGHSGSAIYFECEKITQVGLCCHKLHQLIEMAEAEQQKCHWCKKVMTSWIDIEGYNFCDEGCEDRFYTDKSDRKKLGLPPLSLERDNARLAGEDDA